MRQFMTSFLICWCGLTLVGQEICSNGIDDDQDGLVDLNDPDCLCLGIPVQLDVTDMIPNPDFEDMSCCPKQAGGMHCVDSWANGNWGTVDYIHECGYIPTIQGLVPFPSGSGVLGAIWRSNYKEYPFVCLNEPFEPGKVYTFTLQMGAALFAQDCQPKKISEMSPVDLTLYGNTSCDYPMNTNGCPSSVDSNWQVIGTVNYQPVNEWQEISIVIEPTFEVNGIMFGSPCVLPPEYQPYCYVYFVFDDLRLELEGIELIQVEVAPVGLPCQLDYGLTGFINHQGGQWQWYFNRVAMSGATEAFFSLEDNQYQSGTYQVTYTTADGCSVDSIQITIPPFNITESEVYFCPDAEAECGGMTYNEEGEYMVILPAVDGCDSIIICQVRSYDSIPNTLLEIDACANFSTTICGNVFNATGNYSVTCKNENGCDSVVVLDLRIMNPPQAAIEPPGVLDCELNSWVTLDGTSSSFNELPSGTTTYEWTGDPNGFVGGQFDSVAIISMPGEYCLILTFESNGVSCTDTACVIVESGPLNPSPPTIVGLQTACIGDTLIFQGSYHGLVETYSWEWLLSPDLNYVYLDDSTLAVSPTEAGNISICARLLSECGPSDSSCLDIHVFKHDLITIQGNTCDSTEAGVLIESLTNVHGCDSTVIHEISLSPTHLIQFELTTCDPQQVTSNTVFLINQYGCDSVVTTDIQYVGIDTLYVAKTTCEPSQVGTMVSVLPGVDCDTVQVTETVWVPYTQSEETIILCGQTGILSDTTYLQNSAGCDSLAIRYYEYVSLTSQFQIQGETCAGDQDGHIEIINISGGQAPFELQMNSGNWQSATVFNDLPPGQYTILIRDAAGCRDTLTGLVITPGASLTIDAGPDRIAAPGEVIDLSVQTTQSLSQVQWTATDPLSCPTCLQSTLGPLTTNQTVVVTGWTQEGCSDSDALEVIIKTRGNIFIPNSFTPNGDGINDIFSIYGNDQVSRIRNLAIFDRWGNALYARADLPINDPSAGWDGTFWDEVMDPGVYIYVVEVELIDGSVRLYKEDVTVMR